MNAGDLLVPAWTAGRSQGLLTCKLRGVGVPLLFSAVLSALEQGLARGRCLVDVC